VLLDRGSRRGDELVGLVARADGRWEVLGVVKDRLEVSENRVEQLE
jgi:hypothetical protein